MKSWAHTYMAGSLLGTVLIVAALVAFVPLVSLNAPDEWPTPSLGFGDGGDVGVSSAVAVRRARSAAGEADANPSIGPSVAAGTTVGGTQAHGPELHNGSDRPEDVETVAPPETVAVAPASAQVVARNPGPPAPEGVGVAPTPTENPTGAGSPPAPATTTDGEAGGLGETLPPGPIVAGVGGEEPESQPPEGTGSEPPENVGSAPPPTGSSNEGGNAGGLPGQGGEGEEAQPENSDIRAGSALDLDPGSLWAEVADRSVADLALAAPRLVDVAADR
jgi:hypothetical protein